MKILITGISGTIGTRLAERLLRMGYKTEGIDLVHNKWNKEVNDVTIIGDLTDRSIYESFSADYDMVIHLAANARVFELVECPMKARDNFEMTFNIMEFCRKNAINKIIYASSREIYGNFMESCDENNVPINKCESPYTASKFGCEALVRAYEVCYQLQYVILRFSNVYGMYDDSNRFIPQSIRAADADEDLLIYGREKMLDFTYIDDTVTGVILCIEQFDRAKNNCFNIASGKGAGLLNIAEIIVKKMNSRIKVVARENRAGEILKCTCSIVKAREMLGYEPKVMVEEGIDKSIEWYKKILPGIRR